jgi:Kv channel-interacting protein
MGVEDPAVAVAVFDAFDKNHDGTIDFHEFAVTMAMMCHGSTHDKVRFMWTLVDQNADGFISKEELRKTLRSLYSIQGKYTNFGDIFPLFHGCSQDCAQRVLANSMAENIFSKADANHDGLVSFEEFHAWALQDSSTFQDVASLFSNLNKIAPEL